MTLDGVERNLIARSVEFNSVQRGLVKLLNLYGQDLIMFNVVLRPISLLVPILKLEGVLIENKERWS